MYLSKLELHGFKSFADRTVLHFDPGITAIVGPNGCGKSNIVDAVRWVIGEQRARILRSEKMENVIFNGTAKRKPVGMGEVLLTIENNRGVLPTEYSDVELGRRLYRSGDSDYLMNGVQCRLKDVTDLFMDTGMGAGAYSVIELKMIDEILSDNADDRRRLFEEAAGITKYKLRRRQTLSKLDSTQADLTRIRDLTDEIGKQVRSLRRQAKKAETYKEESTRLRRLELALAHLEYARLTEQRKLIDTEIASLKQESGKIESSEAREETSLSRLRSDLSERESELSQRRAEHDRHLEEIRSLETRRTVAEERLESARREVERARTEQEEAAARRANLEQEAKSLEVAIERTDPELEQAMERLRHVQEDRDARQAVAEQRRRDLQELRTKVREFENQRGEQRRRLDQLINREELLNEDIERSQAQMESMQSSLQELHIRIAEAEEQRTEAESAVGKAQKALKRIAEEQKILRNEVLESTERVRTLERRRDALVAEVQLLESLLSSYEEFSGAVQFLASSDWSNEHLNTVSDVLACDERDQIAVDAALGGFASCVVVQSEDEARRAFEVLRREEQGRVTFIVLDRLRHLPGPTSHGVDADPVLDHIRISRPEFRTLADVLLRDCFVVDTLDEAMAHGSSAADTMRFFARTGEWIDAKGIVHGGSRQEGPSPASGRLGRREQLENARSELAEVEDLLDRSASQLEEQTEQLEALPYDERRDDVRTAERRLNEAEKISASLGFELRSSDSRRAEFDRRREEAESSRRTVREQMAELRISLQDASETLEAVQSRTETAETAAHEAEAESRRASAKHNDASIATLETRNRSENLHRDLERTRRQIDDLQSRFEHREARILELRNVISTTDDKLDDVRTSYDAISGRREELEETVAYADEAVHQTREAINKIEAGLREIRRRREFVTKEEHQRDVRIAEIQTRAADLVEHIQEEFGVDLPRAASGGVDITLDVDEKDARRQITDLRKSIRSLGAVNELALETYEEERERLDFLIQQQEDLENAEEKLMETIAEINTTASDRFMETFELIRTNFQRIFGTLFGSDAGADLILADTNDPLETAIDITARPRGKRPCGIAQLSGGEKTLTAIALLFGIYLVKPSPFCILDEVDAPLDDANVERFMHLIREFSTDTQFILVTHNKRTMEAADRLYGITMQETGVSRLVGVKFDEAVAIVDHAPREAA